MSMPQAAPAAPTPSRVNLILDALLPIIAIAIVSNNIMPGATTRFSRGWPIDAGLPVMDVVVNAITDGGYVVSVNAIDPARTSSSRHLNQAVITLNDGSVRIEKARRNQRVQIIVWAATDDLRDEIADAVNAVLGTDDESGQWLDLGDGTSALMKFASGPSRRDETVQNAQARRSDLLIDIEYGLLSAPISLEEIAQTIAQVDLDDVAPITLTNPPT